MIILFGLGKKQIMLVLGFCILSLAVNAQSDTLIALSSLYSIKLHNPKEVDSILNSLKQLESIYFVQFMYDKKNISDNDEDGMFWKNTKDRVSPKKIRYNLELSWDGVGYSAKLMRETDGLKTIQEENEIKNRVNLFDFIERSISKKIGVPKRNIRTDFSSFTKDTTTSTEKIIVNTIDDLQHLNIYNHQDSLERNYLMALYYFRLAAISKIEDRNKKLDSCKIMLKLAKDFNEIKIAHLHLKCQQYRQFSQHKLVPDTIKNWWNNCHRSDKRVLLDILTKTNERNSGESDFAYIYNISKKRKTLIELPNGNLNILEYLLSQCVESVEIDCSKLNLSSLQADKLSLDFKSKGNLMLKVKNDDISGLQNHKNKPLLSIFTIKSSN